MVLELNQNDDIVVTKRFIKEHLKAHQVQPHPLAIDQKMVRSFKIAGRTYNILLENREWKERWNKRTADMLGQSTIWFASTVRNHRENHFFLRSDIRGEGEEGREIKSKLVDH